MHTTRYNIVFGFVNRYISNQGKVHWEVVKWILRYLKGSTRHGLLFDVKAMNVKSLLKYVNVDHGEDLDKRKSTTWTCFHSTLR